MVSSNGTQTYRLQCYYNNIHAGAALTSGFTNSNAGIIWLDQVACTGSEARLIDCPANPIEFHDCSNFEDVGVRCMTTGSKNNKTYFIKYYGG